MKKRSYLNIRLKLLKTSVLLIFLIIPFITEADSSSKLQKTEILGKEYYIYEVKKGESIYGIAKKNHWDLEELIRLNPEVSNSLKKGERLYYPTGQVSIVTESPQSIEIDFSSLEPIKHKVKKGETVYSISRQYNIPLDIIYKYNPTSKKGVKAGEVIEIPQNGKTEYYYYTVKYGDSLPAIASNYNTSIEDILKNNAGLNINNLKPGEIIRISINSNVGKIKTQMVAEDRISQITGYKVSKNETWDEISEKTGVDVDILKTANKEEENLKENTILNVPLIEKVEVEKIVSSVPMAELSEEKVQEIYDSIKGTTEDERIKENVRMALLLDDPSSKKDIDFTRGLLIGLEDFKNSSYKIDLKIIDGRVASNNIISELDIFEPNIIVSTADRTFPLFLADYGNTYNVQVVNVFDLKNDLFEDNSSIIQLLPPSRNFYNRLANKIFKDNRNRNLYVVGEEDENDGMAEELFALFGEQAEKFSLEDFGSWEPDILQPVLIYSYATKKEEIADFFNNVENLSENNPGFDFKIIGRSNWIALVDDFGHQYEEYSVFVPSRVWLDEESSEWKKFEEQYDKMFEGYPIRSIPNFAASGFDVAKFFIPLVALNHGDFNLGNNKSYENALQNEIDLTRVNNWGGFINETSYLIKYRPGGRNEGIVVK